MTGRVLQPSRILSFNPYHYPGEGDCFIPLCRGVTEACEGLGHLPGSQSLGGDGRAPVATARKETSTCTYAHCKFRGHHSQGAMENGKTWTKISVVSRMSPLAMAPQNFQPFSLSSSPSVSRSLLFLPLSLFLPFHTLLVPPYCSLYLIPLPCYLASVTFKLFTRDANLHLFFQHFKTTGNGAME